MGARLRHGRVVAGLPFAAGTACCPRLPCAALRASMHARVLPFVLLQLLHDDRSRRLRHASHHDELGRFRALSRGPSMRAPPPPPSPSRQFQVTSAPGVWLAADVPLTAAQQQLEFVVTDFDRQHWDKLASGGNYKVEAPGTYTLANGTLAPVVGRPVMVVSDLDGARPLPVQLLTAPRGGDGAFSGGTVTQRLRGRAPTIATLAGVASIKQAAMSAA